MKIMATRKKYDLAVKVSSYTDSTGQQKNRYQNIGAVMEKDDGGKFLMLAKWFNHAGVVDERGGESILVSMFGPRQQNKQSPSPSYAPDPAPSTNPAGQSMGQNPEDDDIPF